MTKPLLPTPVAENLSKQMKATKSRVRLSDFVEDLTSEFGGTKTIAAMMFKEFKDGKPGSIGRAKILDCYTRLLTFVNKKDDTTPVSEMTDAQLEAAAVELAIKAMKAVPIVERTPDATSP